MKQLPPPALGLIALLSGCQTMGPNGGKLIRIETMPPGAIVSIQNAGECETPCTIELDGPRRVNLARIGYKKKEIYVTLDKSRVRVDLEPVAPTADVDAQSLPEL